MEGPNKKEYFDTGKELDFYRGKSFCSKIGGRIMQIESKAQNEFALTMLPEGAPPRCRRFAYLNAKNPERLAGQPGISHYVWLDGSELNYTNWKDGDNENDGVVLFKNDSFWYVTDYSANFYIICERPVEASILNDLEKVLSKISLDLAARETKFEMKLESMESPINEKM